MQLIVVQTRVQVPKLGTGRYISGDESAFRSGYEAGTDCLHRMLEPTMTALQELGILEILTFSEGLVELTTQPDAKNRVIVVFDLENAHWESLQRLPQQLRAKIKKISLSRWKDGTTPTFTIDVQEQPSAPEHLELGEPH